MRRLSYAPHFAANEYFVLDKAMNCNVLYILRRLIRGADNTTVYGGVPEWPKGADCKSVVTDFDGSNPSPSTSFNKTHDLNHGFYFYQYCCSMAHRSCIRGPYCSVSDICTSPFLQLHYDFFEVPAAFLKIFVHVKTCTCRRQKHHIPRHSITVSAFYSILHRSAPYYRNICTQT